MRPTGKLLSEYFRERHGASPGSVRVAPLGRGSHGQGFRVSYKKNGAEKRLIVKTLEGGVGLGHDYPSDRAAVFLLARGSYGRLPGHVKAVDVLAVGRGGRVFSIDGGGEYCLVMEEAQGSSYFDDLGEMGGKASLDKRDAGRIASMASYLARIHRRKKAAPALYYRKLRDTVGHGECLMGVLDTYDGAGFTNIAETSAIEKACVTWRARLRPLSGRLSVVHGDFHPGNILFKAQNAFTLLDRSRGEYGEPADDLTALTINYVFFSLMRHGRMQGAYDEAIRLFYDEYVKASGDGEIAGVVAPFYAFRGVVVANPLFYPETEWSVRERLFGFVHGVLKAREFMPSRVNSYIQNGLKYRKRFI